jgi:hypothetical protein
MAQKKKRGRPPKKVEEPKSSSFWRGLAAVTLMIAGVIMAFGAFNTAPIPKDLWNGNWWLLGAAGVIAPLVLVYIGALKFISDDQRIPLPKLIGSVALLTFLAGWMHATFLHDDPLYTGLIGGHGGHLGSTVGNALVSAFGQFLTSLVFFVLTIFALLFTLGIEPKSLMNLGKLFKKEPAEGEEAEDLAELKKKMTPNFELHEGVPTVHHNEAGAAKLSSLRNTAQKLAPDQDRHRHSARFIL